MYAMRDGSVTPLMEWVRNLTTPTKKEVVTSVIRESGTNIISRVRYFGTHLPYTLLH